MAKLIFSQDPDSGREGYVYFCPGCQIYHKFITKRGDASDPLWTFDGNLENPTFSPSMGVFMGKPDQCHSFVRHGKIEFLSDSHHALAGQTVDLPEVD